MSQSPTCVAISLENAVHFALINYLATSRAIDSSQSAVSETPPAQVPLLQDL